MKNGIIVTIVQDLDKGGTQHVGALLAQEYRRLGYWSVLYMCSPFISERHAVVPAGVDVCIGGDLVALSDILKGPSSGFIHIHNNRIPAQVKVLVSTSGWRVLEQCVWSKYDPMLRVDASLQLGQYAVSRYLWSSKAAAAVEIYEVPYCTNVAVSLVGRSVCRRRTFGRVGQASMAKWSSKYIRLVRESLGMFPDSEWLLVGCPTELRAAIEAEIAVSDRRRVQFLSETHSTEVLRKIYERITDFVHVSNIGESFGLVLVEALAAGCYVTTLASPWTDNTQTELVSQSKCGKVFASVDAWLQFYATKPVYRLSEEEVLAFVRRYSPARIAELCLLVYRRKLDSVEIKTANNALFCNRSYIEGTTCLLEVYWWLAKISGRTWPMADRFFGFLWRRYSN